MTLLFCLCVVHMWQTVIKLSWELTKNFQNSSDDN